MREKLAAYLGEVFWSDLAAHAARDALIVVEEGLDVLEVGVAVASDDKVRVATWIERSAVRKPTALELATWRADPVARFTSLIVAPFVIVRPMRAVRPAPSN